MAWIQPLMSQYHPRLKKARGLRHSSLEIRLGLKYRLIAIGLDGTLINKEGIIPSSSKEAIRLAIDQGAEVTLATWRMYRPSALFAQELGLPFRLFAIRAP